MTTMSIIERILRNRVAFEAKYSKKSKGEEEYYANKGVVAES